MILRFFLVDLCCQTAGTQLTQRAKRRITRTGKDQPPAKAVPYSMSHRSASRQVLNISVEGKSATCSGSEVQDLTYAQFPGWNGYTGESGLRDLFKTTCLFVSCKAFLRAVVSFSHLYSHLSS